MEGFDLTINGFDCTGAATGGGGGGGGTTNYNNLSNRPKINGHTLEGNKSAEQLGLVNSQDLGKYQEKLTAGENITIDENNVISSSGGENGDQRTELPVASAAEEGKIYQYVGATTSSLTNGYFYQCAEVTPATDPKTYEWVQKNVQLHTAYIGGTGIDITNDVISADTTVLATQTDLSNKADASTTYTKTEVDSLIPDVSDFVTESELSTELALKADASTTYTKTEVDGKISGVYRYKGTVTNKESLPVSATEGDVYNVEDSGMNYAWTGTTWDALGSSVDLSSYYTKTETDGLLSAKANQSTTYTKTETDGLLSAKANQSTTYTKTEVDGLLDSKANASTTYTKTEVDNGLSTKQDALVSGTNIKTVGGRSLLGSGDVPSAWLSSGTNRLMVETDNKNIEFVETSTGMTVGAEDDQGESICYADLTSKTYVDKKILEELENFEHLDYEIVQSLPETGENGIRYLLYVSDSSTQGYHYEEYLYVENQWIDIGRFDEIDEATETTAGTIKLNAAQNIGLDVDGKLTIGGRMGVFSGTTGMFSPSDRAPREVGDYSLLITDALGMSIGNRAFAVVSGYVLACKSAAAGATEYRVANNYNNRIICKMAEGGFASRDEATSKVEQIVQVVSVTINGSSFTPDSLDKSSEDIVIKTSESLNPDTAITNIRLFGTMNSYATVHTGNGIKSESGGRNLLLGGGITKAGIGNDNCIVGNGMYSSGNGNAMFGRYHIARQNRGLLAGTGHDTTNAPSEGASAVGQYSYMDANTLFAVGNGSSNTERSNAFEVRNDGIVLKSPNGTRYKLLVDDNGNLTTAAI